MSDEEAKVSARMIGPDELRDLLGGPEMTEEETERQRVIQKAGAQANGDMQFAQQLLLNLTTQAFPAIAEDPNAFFHNVSKIIVTAVMTNRTIQDTIAETYRDKMQAEIKTLDLDQLAGEYGGAINGN